MTTRNEHSLATSAEVTGRGYWSGREVTVTCHPAAPQSGIVFTRTDLPGRPSCPATTTNTEAIAFRTNLRCGDASFQMVEHLMSALSGLEIDNCIVEVNGEELPGLDGSSLAYVDALHAAGLVIQASPRRTLVINEPVRVTLGDSFIVASPCDRMHMVAEYQLDYGHDSPLRAQTHRCEMKPREYARQIAPARTFVTTEQAAQLRASGVGQHVTHKELLIVSDSGPIGNTLRFRDEFARHKLLDLVGDLAIAGVDVIGEIVSHKGGHKLNAMMAAKLSDMAIAQPATRSVSRVQRSQRRAA